MDHQSQQQPAVNYISQEVKYSDPYGNNNDQYGQNYTDFAPASVASNPPKPGFNYTKKRKVSTSMVLQEDMDPEEAEMSKPKSVMMDHSSSQATISRGAGGGRGRGGGFTSRGRAGARGGGSATYGGSRGAISRGGSGGGAFRGSRGGGSGGKGSTAVKNRSVAGVHPAQAVIVFSPGCTFQTVGENKHPNLQNRMIVAITCPDHGWRVFAGAGPNEKVAKHEASYAALKALNAPGFNQLTDHLTSANRDAIMEMRTFRESTPANRAVPGDTKEWNIITYFQRYYGQKAELEMEEPVIIEPSKPPNTLFHAKLTIGEYTFEEVAATKQRAKILVTMTAIKCFDGRAPKFMREEKDETNKDSFHQSVTPNVAVSTQDKVLELVFNAIKEKTENLSNELINVCRFAGILLQQGSGEDIGEYKVITAATGTTSIHEKKLKEDGSRVHDCNAEVLAIRAFRLFLFEQLEKAVNGKESLLDSAGKNKFCLKPKYKVVMAISKVPAGDAMVIEAVSHRGYARNGPIAQQGSPGALQFSRGFKYWTETRIAEREWEKPIIASPADKLTMCNIAGVNGALLDQFVKPVYIDKYILQQGPYFSPDSLNRSFYGRVESGIYKVPLPYKINKPVFESGNYWDPKKSGDKTNRICAGWLSCEREWEIIKSAEGLCIGDTTITAPSRHMCKSDVEYYEIKLENAKKIQASMKSSEVSKKSLFERYKVICAKTGIKSPTKYFDCKGLADGYHGVKLSVNNAFSKANLGTWVQKPINTESFGLDTSNVVNS